MLSRLRLRKVWADLRANEMRSLMGVLAIAIGIFGFGSIMSAYGILNREINANFMGTTPASVKLFVEDADHDLATELEAMPEIAAVELRRTTRARLKIADGMWLPLRLIVVDDFEAMRIATFTSESGAWPPASGELLLERSSISLNKLAEGSELLVKTSNGEPTTIRLSGVVHDPAQAPGWQDGIDYAYVTMGTYALLGEAAGFSEVHVVSAENHLDEAHNNSVAQKATALAETKDYTISAVTVPTPGQHPHADQMDSLLFLLQAFGLLTLILSGILVATIISALVKQQTRQIGAMKAIGGRSNQIAGVYFGMVLILGLFALLLGIPLATSAGNGIASLIATLLNFNITDNTIPSWVLGLQIIVGLAVPLFSAAIPICIGTRMTVREAIGDYNAGTVRFGTSLVDHVAMRMGGRNRPISLAIRNTFRRRTRLTLTVLILAVGGAAFMSSLNINDSWLNTIDIAFASRKYDYKLSLTQPYEIADVESALLSLPEISAVESWNNAIVVETLADGSDGLRFNISAVPPETDYIKYPLLDGRWLRSDDTRAIVINHQMLYDDHIDISVGDEVTLRIKDVLYDFEVVGVIKEVGAPRRGLGIPASAYLNLGYFNEVTGLAGMTSSVRIRSAENSPEFIANTQSKIDDVLKTIGIGIGDLQASETRRFILENHLVVIVAFLVVMAVLIAAVGALALTSVISINIIERSRELGMMRAVGASSRNILQVVMVEGLVIGLLSWVVAAVIAKPLSTALGNAAGSIFIRTDLDNLFSIQTMFAWLALIIAISILASLYPAWNATRLSVREVLSHE